MHRLPSHTSEAQAEAECVCNKLSYSHLTAKHNSECIRASMLQCATMLQQCTRCITCCAKQPVNYCSGH